MRRGGGKGKGSQFERDICKALSLWVTAGKRTDVFWRSAMSGGRATVHHKRGVEIRQAGDICAVSPEGFSLTNKWYIETKFYRDLAIASFLVRNKGKLAEFWRVTKREAKKHGRDPMLIAKQNGWPILVISRTNHVAHWTQPQLYSSSSFDVTLFDSIMERPYERS